MVLHMPWDRNLGGPRVQLELAEEFEKLGHHVEKFDFHDAFPNRATSRWRQIMQPHCFSSRAVDFVQRNGNRFDVIDAHQGNLPASKSHLRFNGILVVRSVGLIPFYQDFARFERARWPSKKTWKSILRRMLNSLIGGDSPDRFKRSLEFADLINVPNDDEYRYIEMEMGLGHKCRVLPFGLSDGRMEAFAKAGISSANRLGKQTVAFVGAWGQRKGSKDWGEIIRQVRLAVPGSNFLFLGTASTAETVYRDVGLPPCDWIRVIPSFESAQLPELLAEATIGAFPSYVEGFPFAVLEKLAAGLPVLAYDVPGPRAMLQEWRIELIVRSGDIDAFATRLSSLLRLDIQSYVKLSNECRVAAQQFRWRDIAVQTLAAYQERIVK